MKKYILIMLFIVMISSFGLAAQNKNNDDFESIISKKITLKWKIEEKNLHIIILSAETEGWLAVGFNPTKKMKDANIRNG
ncbi:MAG: hypothetical protein J7K04_05515 [Spirochaetales bacterium]|nr:hypothetical protein [Spirochaetales bacterium]